MVVGAIFGFLVWLAIRRAIFGRWWLLTLAIAFALPGRAEASGVPVVSSTANLGVTFTLCYATRTGAFDTYTVNETCSPLVSGGTFTVGGTGAMATASWGAGAWVPWPWATSSGTQGTWFQNSASLSNVFCCSVEVNCLPYTDESGQNWYVGYLEFAELSATFSFTSGSSFTGLDQTPSAFEYLQVFVPADTSQRVLFIGNGCIGAPASESIFSQGYQGPLGPQTFQYLGGVNSGLTVPAAAGGVCLGSISVGGDLLNPQLTTSLFSTTAGFPCAIVTVNLVTLGVSSANTQPATAPSGSVGPTTSPFVSQSSGAGIVAGLGSMGQYASVPTTDPSGGADPEVIGTIATMTQANMDAQLTAIYAGSPDLANQVVQTIFQRSIHWPASTDPDPVTLSAPSCSAVDGFFNYSGGASTVSVGGGFSMPGPSTLFGGSSSSVNSLLASAWAGTQSAVIALGSAWVPLRYLVDFICAACTGYCLWQMWLGAANIHGKPIPGLGSLEAMTQGGDGGDEDDDVDLIGG